MQFKAIFLFPLFFILGLLLAQCASPPKKGTDKTSKQQTVSNLTQGEAQQRAKIISHPSYKLKMDFETNDDFYRATADIKFNVILPVDTFLDFKGNQIHSFTVNGKSMPVKLENSRLLLSKEDLVAGLNEVQVSYTQNFSKNGRGIYRFVDSQDNKVYIWTKLEPFDASHVFPCFDQPDLKGLFSLEVSAPKHWKIIFTTLESNKSIVGEKTLWTFPESPIMSTYLFSLHAGDYEVWSDRYKNIPLRLFVRASLKQYVKPDFWFSITKKGFNFFEKEFDYPYPFKKYDQLIVPEFSSGGMENIAAVNYSERFVSRGEASREEKENLANVLIHEMAHMWFGDLVTMTWWDDLWLNESFATYMAYTALEKATEFKDAWSSFQKSGKLRAYTEDQYPTTHPISTPVADTNATLNQFDAITYSKGASAVRQLAYYLGEDTFRKGVRLYFKEHAYKNTTLDDFISSLQKASNENLDHWSQSWLRTSGVETLKVSFDCKDSKLTRVNFELVPPIAGQTTRPHRIPITLYKVKTDSLKSWSIEDWKSQSANESRSINASMECPDFILANTNDVTYVKLSIDHRQIQWAQEHLHKVPSAQARGVFWNQTYLNLRDGTLKIEDFIKLFSAQIGKEKNQNILQQFFMYWGALAKYLPQKSELHLSLRAKALEQLEKHFWNLIVTTNDPSWQKTLLINWSRRLESASSQEKLIALLNGSLKLKPLILDQDIRWQMIQRLSALGHPNADQLITEARAQDNTETGFKSYLVAEASKPSLKDKTKWLEEMNRPGTNWSLARKQSLLFSMFPSTPKQTQLRNEFRHQFYKTMSILDIRNEDVSYSRSYADLAPSSCDESIIQEFQDYISKQNWNPVIKKTLTIQNHENSLCLRIQRRSFQ